MKSNLCTSRRIISTLRSGRALVECIVAMFLLAVTALSMVATAHGTLSLADDAMLVAHAQSMATSRVEDAMALPCGTSVSGTDQLPRMTGLWQQSGGARSTELHLDMTLDRSPIALASAPIQFGIQAGGICP
ncbi:MAG: hypothetical protein ABJB74_18310 [Gemmatimonas sp.]